MEGIAQGFVAKRFRQVLVDLEHISGLGLKIPRRVQRGHQDDFDSRAMDRLQTPGQLTPVYFGHERIGEHHVEDRFVSEAQGFFRAGDRGDVVTHLLDIAAASDRIGSSSSTMST